MGKGKAISNEVRNVLYKVLTYFEMEKKNKNILLPLDRAFERTAIATGVPKRTIRRIKQEAMRIKAAPLVDGSSNTDTIDFTTITRKRKMPKKRLDINDTMIEGIRKIIHRFQTESKEVVTLKKILFAAKNEYNFPGKINTLRRVLKEELGCKFKKCDKGHWELIIGKAQDLAQHMQVGSTPSDIEHVIIPVKLELPDIDLN